MCFEIKRHEQDHRPSACNNARTTDETGVEDTAGVVIVTSRCSFDAGIHKPLNTTCTASLTPSLAHQSWILRSTVFVLSPIP